MKENIIIVSGGIDNHLVRRAIAQLGTENVIVVDAENVKEQLPFPKSEPFILKNPYPIENFGGQRQFFCKGKHQYRETKTECGDIYWTCQCGRVLGTYLSYNVGALR